MNHVKMIALKPFNFGNKEITPPPAGAKRSVASRYTIELGPTVAQALYNNGLAAPAFDDDALNLKKMGCRCVATWPGKEAPKLELELEPEDEAESLKEIASLKDIALESGLKKDLVAALDDAGVDTSDLKTNGERVEKLKKLK
jgi:hypothetical protein